MKKTVKEKYDMKNANELIYRVAGARYTSRIDLNSFYYQLRLATECRHYTGFNTPWTGPRFQVFQVQVLIRLCHAYHVHIS